ncbi:MAG: SGNH/GDSL hydrolase family protein [Lachnospiraceae bacterium]|nr:SGNH/GDSL hydrolase family protein [Lachnospiraceae bacterium]
MINILCFGDSNTYGYNPANGMRYSEDVRWTGKLQSLLGKEYHVIEEGCNGRTTVFDDPFEEWKKGADYLKPCLNTHKPLDIVIMMLGSNDLKKHFNASAEQIAQGAEILVKEIISFTDLKQGFVPKIILVSPPEIGSDILTSDFARSFDETAITRSKEFPKYYKEVADRNGCIFFNAAQYIKPSKIDSLHLDPGAHEIFAKELSLLIKKS